MSFADTLNQAKEAAVELQAKRDAQTVAKDRYDSVLKRADLEYVAAVASAKEVYNTAVEEAKAYRERPVSEAKAAFDAASREVAEAQTNLQTLRSEILSVFGDVLEPPNPRVRVAS